MAERLLDRELLRRAFDLLGARLARRGVVGEVHVFGGAAMVLTFNERAATRDADDLRLLLHTLDLHQLDDVIAIVARYFPDEPLNDRSRDLLEDLLAEQR